MKKYLNLSKNSGVESFLIESHSITVKFKDDGTYLYNYSVPGKHHVEEMKVLAQLGQGLATYINKYVRKSYALKLA